MARKKYYSPTIDDIRPGLVYERLNGQIWELKQLVLEDYIILGGHSVVFELIHEIFVKQSESIRIPLLDVEDIRNLGFDKIEEKGHDYKFKKGKFTLLFDDVTMTMTIQFNTDVLFCGKVFNTCELLDLLIKCDVIPNRVTDGKLSSIKYGLRGE